MRESKFTFIPEAQLTRTSSDPVFRVTVTSGGMLYFPRDIVDIYDLDKKWFKFYADLQKKVVAWKTIEAGNLEEFHKARKLTIVNAGAGTISIQKLLSALGIGKLNGSIPNVPVQHYKGSALEEEVNYIIIDEKAVVKKGKGGRRPRASTDIQE